MSVNFRTQPQPRQLRFSVDEYYKLIEPNTLKDYEKAEIIEGELLQKTPIGERRAHIVDKLNRMLIKQVSDDVLVRVQNPLRISDYDEPDFLLADLTRYDGKRHPRLAETLVVIEVSDTTLKYDRFAPKLKYRRSGSSI